MTSDQVDFWTKVLFFLSKLKHEAGVFHPLITVMKMITNQSVCEEKFMIVFIPKNEKVEDRLVLKTPSGEAKLCSPSAGEAQRGGFTVCVCVCVCVCILFLSV